MSRYTSEDLKHAVSAYKKHHLSLRKASVEYGVPRSTIYDSAKCKSGLRGRTPDMDTETEQALVNYILYNSDRGFPMSRHMIRCYVKEILRRSEIQSRINKETGPTDQWFRNFYKRHPELSEKSAENMDSGRTRMSNADTMAKWFSFLDATLEKHGLKNLQDRIYNCDETGWSGKESGKAKVVGRKGGHTFKQKMAVSSHITAHLCVCADGRFLPTMLIFQGSLPHREFKDGLPSSWLYASAESGYMDGDLFLTWFKSCFLTYCTRDRPVCLIMDNHDSHITLPLIESAIENDVLLVGLPGHTTHILQPLDVKIIGPLKGRCATIAERCGFINNSFSVSKAKFPLLLNYAIDQTPPSSVKESFRATGICPLDPDAIDKTQIVPASYKKHSTSEENSNDSSGKTTCPTCGVFPSNPLVQNGLVPQHLADVLVPSPTKPLTGKRKSRIVAEGRVISGSEMLEKLKEREAAAAAKKERQDERKRKRLVKEEDIRQKKEKKIKKSNSKVVSSRVQESLPCSSTEEQTVQRRDRGLASIVFTCGVCSVRGRNDDEANGIEWVGCDEEMCLSWYHMDCLSESEREYVSDSLAGGSDWFCRMCKPWLYDEE